jgi:signal transduction histidine kinase
MAGGLEGVLLSAALSGAGMLMNNRAAQDAENRQRRILRNAEEATRKKNQQKNELLQNFTDDTYNPERRLQSYEDAATQTENKLTDAVKSEDTGSNGVPINAQGRLSDDYMRGNAEAGVRSMDDILERARLMARAGAGSNMFMGEGMRTNELNSQVGILDSAGRRIANDAATRANGVRNNGSLVGGLLMGAAPAASNIKWGWGGV